jgi:uncharacterized protein (TIGR02145 family)
LGRVWLDRNLGATRVATLFEDTEARGYFYQWGRDDDGHELESSRKLAVLANSITPATNAFIISSSVDDWATIDRDGSLRTAAWADGGVNDICPVGFSVPTREELKKDTHDTYDTTVSLTPQAFNSFLKIPASGYRNSKNGDYQHFVHTVHMWTRSANANNLNAYYLYLNKNDTGTNVRSIREFPRGLGMTVRCIKDI